MNTEIKDILIIGAGPVGLYAQSCAGLLGLSGYIIENHNVVGGQPVELYPDKEIYDIPGISAIKTSEFITRLSAQATLNAPAITLSLNTNVVNMEHHNDHYAVSLTNDQVVYVKTILITSGNGSFSPRKLDFPIDCDNLHYKFEGSTEYQDKDVVILGGGDSAVDWALYLAKNNIAKTINLIHRRDLYRAKESNVHELANFTNIHQYKPYTVDAIDNKNHHATAIHITHSQTGVQETIPCDVILVQYGANISPSPINTWNLKFNKANKIEVDTTGATGLAGIFAAGNVVSYPGKYYNMTSGFGEVVNALLNITKFINGAKYNPGYLIKK